MQQNTTQLQSFPCPAYTTKGVLMPRFNTPCLDCGQLSRNGSRCGECQAQRNLVKQVRQDTEARREKKKQLYNYAYRQRAKLVRENATHCHICKQGYRPNDPFEADHLVPGNPDSPLAPAHRSCNQSRGNATPPAG